VRDVRRNFAGVAGRILGHAVGWHLHTLARLLYVAREIRRETPDFFDQ
jgi:hypothetical protein